MPKLACNWRTAFTMKRWLIPEPCDCAQPCVYFASAVPHRFLISSSTLFNSITHNTVQQIAALHNSAQQIAARIAIYCGELCEDSADIACGEALGLEAVSGCAEASRADASLVDAVSVSGVLGVAVLGFAALGDATLAGTASSVSAPGVVASGADAGEVSADGSCLLIFQSHQVSNASQISASTAMTTMRILRSASAATGAYSTPTSCQIKL